MWSGRQPHGHEGCGRGGFPGGQRFCGDDSFGTAGHEGYRPGPFGRFGRHDKGAPSGRGCEDSAVSNQMGSWSGDERRKSFQQLESFKDHMRRPVSPGVLEAIEKPPVWQRFQTFHRDRWPGAVSGQTFQPLAVLGRNRDIRVHAETPDAGATQAGQNLQALRVDLIPSAGDAPAGVGSKGCPAGYGGGVEARQPRLIAQERIRLFRIAVGSQAPTEQHFRDPIGQRRGQSRNFRIPRSFHLVESRMAGIIGCINPIDGQHVQVQIQIQSRTETLYEGHGAALRIRQGVALAGPANQRAKNSSGENAENIADQPGIVGQAVAQRPRKRQYPLPDGDQRKYTVDEMGGRIGHPTATTGIAKAPLLTRERDDTVQPAGIAMHANETVSQNATIQKLPELALDKARNVTIAFTLPGEEDFQMFGDDTVKRVFFRIARPVVIDRHEGMGYCNRAGNPRDNRLSNFRAGRLTEVRLQCDGMSRLSLVSRLVCGVGTRTTSLGHPS